MTIVLVKSFYIGTYLQFKIIQLRNIFLNVNYFLSHLFNTVKHLSECQIKVETKLVTMKIYCHMYILIDLLLLRADIAI